MNRRQFFGAMIAPIGAIAAVKCQLALPESAKEKLMRWYHAGAPPMKIDPKPAIWGTSICETDSHRWHQEQLSKWLANKVDREIMENINGKG